MVDTPKKDKDIAHLSRREFVEYSLKVGLIFASMNTGTFIMDKAFAADKEFNAFGLGVSLQERIIKKFKEDIGITVHPTLGATQSAMMNRFIMGEYKTFSTIEIVCTYGQPIVEKGVSQPIPLAKLTNWKPDTVHPIFYDDGGPYAKYIWTDLKNKSHLKHMPLAFNTDCFGYLPEKITEWGWDPLKATWALLYDEKYAGRVAINDDPTLEINHVLTYLSYHGKIPKVKVPGDPTKEEIDQAMDFLFPLKKRGQFRVIWDTYGQIVNLFAQKEIWISYCWNPVVEDVKRLGTKILYGHPIEGGNYWYYGIIVSKAAPDPELAFKYADWWLSGWPGAQIATQGYYSPVPQNVKKYLGEKEFGYWFEGKENPDRAPYNFREGGTLEQRFKRNAVFMIPWMKNYDYMMKVWRDFKAA
ncbi:MAG: PotD/PotF family extracellular solute-binding protein [Pseudomonadota bacterium]